MHRITIANHLSSWSPDLTDRSDASLFFFKILVAMSGSGQLWSEVKLKHKYITVSKAWKYRRPHFHILFFFLVLSDLKTIIGLKIWKTESSWITFSVSDYCVVYVLFNMWKFWSSEFDTLWEMVFVFPFSVHKWFFYPFLINLIKVWKKCKFQTALDSTSEQCKVFFTRRIGM